MTTAAAELALVGDAWIAGEGGDPLDVLDPANERVVATAPRLSRGQLDDAVRVATEAGHDWAVMPPWDRSRILRRIAGLLDERAEEVAAVLTSEQGKPLREARSEVALSVEYFDWFADESRRIYGRVLDGRTRQRRIEVIHHPIGLVAAFTPSNFPLMLPARKIAAAVAAGCSIILKPAEDTPLSSLILARICLDAGLPPGVLNVATGDPAEISAALVGSRAVRKVSLTGSVSVGRNVLHLAADRATRTSMELGGHAPVVVLPTDDVAALATTAVAWKFRNGGQVCTAPTRFLVVDEVHDTFVAAMAEAAERLVMGPGGDEATTLGPLINERRRTAVEAMISDAVAGGATVVTGGGRGDRPRGYFHAPTVLTDVTPTMSVMRDEPFGPIAPIMRVADADTAVAVANAVDVGLAGYVFGSDTLAAERVARRLEVGMVAVNSFALALPEAPFGGVKASGFGSEGGTEGIHEYLVPQYLNLEA